jgi:hypothetical protein
LRVGSKNRRFAYVTVGSAARGSEGVPR